MTGTPKPGFAGETLGTEARFNELLNQAEKVEVGEVDAKINQLLSNIDASVRTPPPTPRELNVAEQSTAMDEAPVRQPKVAPRFDLKADLESKLQDPEGGVSGGTVDIRKNIPSGEFRFWLGRSRSIQEMKEKFYNRYPEGELMPVTDSYGNKRLLWRKTPDEEWGVTGDDMSTAIGKIVTPQTAAAIGTAILTRGRSLTQRAGAQAGTGFVSEGADIGIEEVFGFSRRMTPSEMLVASGVNALVAAGGEFLPGAVEGVKKIAGKIVDWSPKNIFMRDLEAGKKYVEAAEKEGLEPPMIGQATGDPRSEQLFAQVSGGSKIPQDIKAKQTESLRANLERKAETGSYGDLTGVELKKLAELEKAIIIDDFVKTIKPGSAMSDVTTPQADAALQQKLLKWRGAETAAIAEEFTGGKVGSKIRFNTSNLKAIGQDLPTYAQAADGGVVEIGGPKGSLKTIVDKIDALASQMVPTASGAETRNAVQQIVLLRDQVSDILRTATGQQREYAEQVLTGIKDMMANPVGAKGWAPAIQQRVTNAMERMQKYEDSKDILSGYIKGGDPNGLSERFFKPNNFKALETLRDVHPEEFELAREAFSNRLYADPKNVGKILDEYTKTNNEGTLRLFMSERDEAAWRTFSDLSKKQEAAKYNVLAKADTTGRENAEGLIFGTGTPGKTGSSVNIVRSELEDFIRLSGGKESAKANGLRAGIYGKILNDSMEVMTGSKGERVLNPATVRRYIDELKSNENNLNSLMRPKDWEALDNLAAYANMLESTTIGGQLQQASQLSKIVQVGHLFQNPKHYFLTIAAFYNQNTIARMMANPVSSEMLKKAIEQGPTREGLSNLRAATAVALEGAVRDSTREREIQ